jgi:hypothetical protein
MTDVLNEWNLGITCAGRNCIGKAYNDCNSKPVQFTGKMHQRCTNKIHLPAEEAATVAVVLHEIFLISVVGKSSKSLMNL